MNFRQFLGLICAKNPRESGISNPPCGAPLKTVHPFYWKGYRVDISAQDISDDDDGTGINFDA